jgi:nucleotide-binding universal stress UspA family protein
LIKIAAAIAHGLHYELECVHVVAVPRSVSPAEARVDLQAAEPLRQLAMSYADHSGLSVHFQVRAAHEIGRALLEIISDRHIDLVLMGWHHPSLTPGRVISGVVDTLIRQALCQVVVVRPGRNLTFNHWLIPTAGGPNAQSAQTLLPGLIDAHVHSYGGARKDALRFGVTTVLDMFRPPFDFPEVETQRDSLSSTNQADLFSAGFLATEAGGHGTQYGIEVPTLSDSARRQPVACQGLRRAY